MTPSSFIVYGFEGRGGRYVVLDTFSALEARELEVARTASGFTTAVFQGDKELTREELDALADLEERFA